MPHARYLLLALSLCVAMAMPVGGQENQPATQPPLSPPAPPPREQATMFIKAAAAVDRGDLAAARAELEMLLTGEPHPAVRRSALILRGQIDGTFKPRQAFWRDREVVDRVVLVDDEAAFLDAVGQWTPRRFWPVLIEDEWFTPMFVAAFTPHQVLRWSADSGHAPEDIEPALSDVIKAHNRRLLFHANDRPRPPGIVALDTKGSLWTGGLALALGRRQPVVNAVIGDNVHRVVDAATAIKLNSTLMAASARVGLHGRDEWFGLTLAGGYPYRYHVTRGEQTDSTPKQVAQSMRAMDDLIGRSPSLGGPNPIRSAVVGRLTGGPAQGVYQAMCSLFLQPSRMLWLDTYAQRDDRQWQQFNMTPAVMLMRGRVRCDLLASKQLNIAQFRAATRPINPYGMIWMNTSGESAAWTIPGKGRTDDFPIGAATVMHVIHSHSLASAWNNDTLAGRAISGGAFWYFGAMNEPFLHAFSRPAGMAGKILAGTPIAFSARRISLESGSLPWRLMLVGDPLYVLRQTPATRVPPSDRLETTRLVAVRRDAPLTQRLRDAVLVDPKDALALAVECLKHVETLEPDDLLRAVTVLYAKKRFGFLSAVPDGVAQHHPMAAVIVRLSRLSRSRGVVVRETDDGP